MDKDGLKGHAGALARELAAGKGANEQTGSAGAGRPRRAAICPGLETSSPESTSPPYATRMRARTDLARLPDQESRKASVRSKETEVEMLRWGPHLAGRPAVGAGGTGDGQMDVQLPAAARQICWPRPRWAERPSSSLHPPR